MAWFSSGMFGAEDTPEWLGTCEPAACRLCTCTARTPRVPPRTLLPSEEAAERGLTLPVILWPRCTCLAGSYDDVTLTGQSRWHLHVERYIPHSARPILILRPVLDVDLRVDAYRITCAPCVDTFAHEHGRDPSDCPDGCGQEHPLRHQRWCAGRLR